MSEAELKAKAGTLLRLGGVAEPEALMAAILRMAVYGFYAAKQGGRL